MSDLLTLTPERIAKLLTESKQRGIYVSDIQNHVDSGELACNFSELPYYKGKDYNAVRNSINGNIEKHGVENEWPTLTVAVDKMDTKDKTKWQVILVNMDVLTAMQAGTSDDE